MADNYAICFIGAMDRLWFHQTILFPEPASLLPPKTLKSSFSISESLKYHSSNNSKPLLPEGEISPVASIITSTQIQSQDDIKEDLSEKEIKEKERPTKLNHGKSSSHSSLPSTHKRRSRNFRSSAAAKIRLQKTMSCKSLVELELEEVKGFMDLGFIFSKQHMTPRMMSVIPGLQRLDDELGFKDDEKIDGREDKRPYLSEAWLLRGPYSPLLNLRIPTAGGVSSAVDMKRHLKYWAKTVASVIRQES